MSAVVDTAIKTVTWRVIEDANGVTALLVDRFDRSSTLRE